ncbi:MAG: hypothetical protein MZV49_06825 [Rhodopseudomonas palustris]|nr:hypothetical protein [Rhodopseudomonas palustris]
MEPAPRTRRGRGAGDRGRAGRGHGPAHPPRALRRSRLICAPSPGRTPTKAPSRPSSNSGGMGRFVPKGATVGLLINHQFRNPGAHVNPDVAAGRGGAVLGGGGQVRPVAEGRAVHVLAARGA